MAWSVGDNPRGWQPGASWPIDASADDVSIGALARMFESLPDEAWAQRGTVNGGAVSVRALAYITAGHAKHHLNVLRERYGVA